jgi:hypothetical protein
MGIAALICWILTAAGGFAMLRTWISRGGMRNQGEGSTSSFPPALIFGHFLLAAVGLVLWILYLVLDSDVLTWVAFIVLIPVAALGFVMLARWIPVYQARVAGSSTATTGEGSAESHIPTLYVAGHGLLAVVTVVLVLLTALGVGGS